MKADFGKITKITKIEDLTAGEKYTLGQFNDFPDLEAAEYDGYLIECVKTIHEKDYHTKIGILLEDEPQCCERYGMVISDDDIKSFIGAELIEAKEITAGDINLITDHELRGDEDTRSVFFNLETDRGLLQFVVYNCHNGFYGHDCHFVISYHNKRTESTKTAL